MKLNQYIKKQGITLAIAADDLGVTRQAISLWNKGMRTPRPGMIDKIQIWSKGKVCPADFYGDK